MLYKAEADIKKGEEFFICDKCLAHAVEPHFNKHDEDVLCKKCFDYACDMGDMAAEAAMEQEAERKHELGL